MSDKPQKKRVSVKMTLKAFKKIKKYALGTIFTTAIFVSLGTISKNKQKEFDTSKGKRNLSDYADFLAEEGINVNGCYAEASETSKTSGIDVIDVWIYEIKKTKGEHTVSEKDTIESIVKAYGMDRTEFLNNNHITSDDDLKVGEKVKIYFHKFYYYSLENLDQHSKYYYHTIEYGDTLTGIAETYGVTIEELQRYNKIPDINNIALGETIKIKKDLEKEETTTLNK